MSGLGFRFAFAAQSSPLSVLFSAPDARLCRVRMSVDERMASRYSRRQAVIQIGGMLALSIMSPHGDGVKAASAETNANVSAVAASALVPLISLRMSLSQLGSDIEGGTNGDLRRTIRTLQKGIDIVSSARRASATAKLSKSDSENVRIHVRDAAEFINQIVDYYEPTARNERPPAEVLQFSLNALKSASDQLDQAIRVFSKDVVRQATEIVEEGGIM